jgi:hypothetical protein
MKDAHLEGRTMKTLIALCISVLTIISALPAWAQAPMGVGGFTLEQPIGQFSERLIMETVMPIRYQPYLAEVQIEETAAFKSGLITYGQCDQSGSVVRIKLKYREDSKKFFETLLQRYRQRFGKPDEYRGDPFHIMTAWKWSFEDAQGNRISLTLQHNTKDYEQKRGTAVKLTHTDAIERERACYSARFPSRTPSNQVDRKFEGTTHKPDWDLLIPR